MVSTSTPAQPIPATERKLERAAESKGWLASSASLDRTIDVLKPFADCEAMNHLERRKPDEAVLVRVGDVCRAAAMWRKLCGLEEPTPAQPTNKHASA